MNEQSGQQDVESLDQVIAEIEDKLATLDERRADLERKIQLKRARVEEINDTIEDLENLDATIQEPPEA